MFEESGLSGAVSEETGLSGALAEEAWPNRDFLRKNCVGRGLVRKIRAERVHV